MWHLKKPGRELYIASHIDSSGMSLIWSELKNADHFGTEDDARSFYARAKERFPKEQIEVVFKHG